MLAYLSFDKVWQMIPVDKNAQELSDALIAHTKNTQIFTDMKPIMYIKNGCPWCIAAEKFFKAKGVSLEIKDVRKDAAARKRMESISGQTKTPTLEYGDFLVADFDTDEFMVAVNKRPDVKKALGL